jgi:hypothetical protein
MDEPDNPEDLTEYPGGWWEGVLTSYDYDTKLWVFHFVDYDHDEWFVELELSVELYDPYYMIQ